jgi:type I restriction-modification system DNA methylase subunit
MRKYLIIGTLGFALEYAIKTVQEDGWNEMGEFCTMIFVFKFLAESLFH